MAPHQLILCENHVLFVDARNIQNQGLIYDAHIRDIIIYHRSENLIGK